MLYRNQIKILVIILFIGNNVFCSERSNSVSVEAHRTFWTMGDTPGALLKTDFRYPLSDKYGIQAGLGFTVSSDLSGLVEREFGKLPSYYYMRDHYLYEIGLYRSINFNDIDNSRFNLFLTIFYLSGNKMLTGLAAVNKKTDELIIENYYYIVKTYGFGLILDYKFDFYKNTRIGPIAGWRYLVNDQDFVWSLGIKLLVNLH